MTRAEAEAVLRALRPALTAAWEALGRPRIHFSVDGHPVLALVPQDWYEEAAVTVGLARLEDGV